MLYQKSILFKFVFSLGNSETIIGKINQTIKTTNSILVLVVRRCYHTNGLRLFTKSVVKSGMFSVGRTWTKNKVFFNFWVFKTFRLQVFFSPHQLNSNLATLAHPHLSQLVHPFCMMNKDKPLFWEIVLCKFFFFLRTNLTARLVLKRKSNPRFKTIK